MTSFLKRIFFNLLGLSSYLKLLQYGFKFSYNLGWLKSNYIYKYHYFSKNLIRPGDTVIDLGANLGYYSSLFSKWVGDEGKVVSIEPVKPFFDALSWGLSDRLNCQLFNCALGEENKKITMQVPTFDGYFRPGLAHIPSEGSLSFNESSSFEVDLVDSKEFFNQFDKIDFIKCDVEGYEAHIIPLLKDMFEKHKPLLQIEIFGESLVIITKFMKENGYLRFGLYKNKLIQDFDLTIEFGDSLFVHQTKVNSLSKFV